MWTHACPGMRCGQMLSHGAVFAVFVVSVMFVVLVVLAVLVVLVGLVVFVVFLVWYHVWCHVVLCCVKISSGRPATTRIALKNTAAPARRASPCLNFLAKRIVDHPRFEFLPTMFAQFSMGRRARLLALAWEMQVKRRCEDACACIYMYVEACVCIGAIHKATCVHARTCACMIDHDSFTFTEGHLVQRFHFYSTTSCGAPHGGNVDAVGSVVHIARTHGSRGKARIYT